MNRIKRNTIFIEVVAKTNSSAFKAGEKVGNYRDDNMWIAKDRNGKKWRNLTSNLRNSDYYDFVNQYSLEDIVYYLMDRNADYQTVLWESLVSAVKTAFNETIINNIDDLYNYIVSNLI